MAERPPILGRGSIIRVREDKRLFDVRMPNGYVAIAVLPKDGPACPREVMDLEVAVAFSPYDMSRSKIMSFGPASPEDPVLPDEGNPEK